MVLIANHQGANEGQSRREVARIVDDRLLGELDGRVDLVAVAMQIRQFELRGERMRIELQRIVEGLASGFDIAH